LCEQGARADGKDERGRHQESSETGFDRHI
jgi:hypothetical protein